MSETEKLSLILDDLGLGAWQYHEVINSTNDLALEWAQEGAPDWSLVVADAQIKGRGRGDHTWVTNPGAGLAMSLVLHPTPEEAEHLNRFTALAAVSLSWALAGYGLQAEIKWPNDILLDRKKVAGVLVEADWQGDAVRPLVLGMGVNITPAAIPDLKAIRYPAACVTEFLQGDVDRWVLLGEILQAMMIIRLTLTQDAFIAGWNANLAFRDEWVMFRMPDAQAQRMKVIGMNAEGCLVMENKDGERVSFIDGEILMTYNEV